MAKASWDTKILATRPSQRLSTSSQIIGACFRESQRDALVDYLMHNRGWTRTSQLFGELLIDPEMSACQLTSRIKSAIGSVQTFVQRIFLGLEVDSNGDPTIEFDEDAAAEWEWVKSYRIWEANRKVFLYPENWLEPDWRDVKSELFLQAESELNQGELTHEAAERAYRKYLEGLDDIAKLEVASVYREKKTKQQDGQLHVLARTLSVPRQHYYRALRSSGEWTPWRRVEVEVQGDHPLLWMVSGRLLLFWTEQTVHEADAGAKDTPAHSNVVVMMSEHRSQGFGPPQRSPEATMLPYWALELFVRTQVGLADTDWKPTQYMYASYGLDSCGRTLGLTQYAEVNDKDKEQKRFLPVPRAAFLKGQVYREHLNETDIFAILFASAGSLEHVVLFQKTPSTYGATAYLYASDHLANRVPFTEFFFHDDDRVLYAHLESLPIHNWAFDGRYLPAKLRPPMIRSVPRGPSDASLSDSIRAPLNLDGVQVRKELFVFDSFYHPYACSMMAPLRKAGGVDEIRKWDSADPLQRKSRDYFDDDYKPNYQFVADQPRPFDDFDFSFTGAYSIYNWELFFHLPFLIATRLNREQRYAEARDWFHSIFDPTSGGPDPVPKRFWKVKPFYENDDIETIQQQLLNGNPTSDSAKMLAQILGITEEETTLAEQIEAWRADPFNPHLIARMRIIAYQKVTVMRYIQNLIDWGDQLFRRDSIESINEATQLYLMAQELLGERPVFVDPPERKPMTFKDLEDLPGGLDDFSNALVQLENTVDVTVGAENASTGGPITPAFQLYFCIQPNEELLKLWDLVEDRLYKIRHCMNIEGIVRELPLFEPPIDPALLIAARAAGLDLSSVLDDLASPRPNHRFASLLPRAVELAQMVSSFGSALLSAIEKEEGERLALLRQEHEIAVLEHLRETRREQVKEAQEQKRAIEASRAVVAERHTYFSEIERVSGKERQAQVHATAAMIKEVIAGAFNTVAGVLFAIPQIIASPMPGSEFGGQNLGGVYQAIANVASTEAGIERFANQMLTIEASYERRWQDWKLQERTSALELKEIDRRIAAADIAVELAKREHESVELQIENAKEVEDYLKTKFSNEQLYGWMRERLSETYFGAYQLAYEMAKMAEKAFGYERGESDTSFIKFGYWDSRRKGLVAGEKLLLDLRQMEAAYLKADRREYELTKHISLASRFGLNLIELVTTGKTILDLDEALFDRDYPGHYMRRLKAVSITIPAVTGPHTTINCRLTLLSSRVRMKSTVGEGYSENTEEPDSRFLYHQGAIQSICTSTGQNDSGLFEVNFRDERYLPFEGCGAISRWQIEIDPESNELDLNTITDVVLHLSYTAREGGGLLGKAAKDAALAAAPRTAVRLFSLRHEFAAEWSKLEEELDAVTGDQSITVDFGGKLPFLAGVGDPRTLQVGLIALWRHTTARLDVMVTAPSSPAETEQVIVPAPEPPMLIQPPTPEPSTGAWTIRIPQSVVTGPAVDPSLIEDWPTNPSFKRLKPSELRDIVAIVTIERDPKLAS